MLTVSCVFVRGPYPYTPEYVVRLEAMCRRWIDRPFEFVVFTDQPERFPGFTRKQIEVGPHPADGYWGKVQVFDPRWKLTGRCLYLDLDSLIVAPLDPIIDAPAQFALTEDALVQERQHLDRDRYGRQLVRRFNSSVMVWDGGTQDHLARNWSPAVAERLSTDQDWIGEQCPEAMALPLAWFPRISQVRPPWPDEAKVVLVKKPKNHEAVKRWPELAAWWGGEVAA